MATVVITRDAAAQFDDLPLPIKARVLHVFKRLEQWPNVSGAKPLREELAGQFRIRTGDYRVQISIDGETVTIVRVGHRDGFYEG